MLTRRTILGSLGILALGLVTSVAALAHQAMGGRPTMVKRFVTAIIDDALDEARATPDQRTAIYAVRDRVMATVEAQRLNRRAAMAQLMVVFQGDQMDRVQLDAIRQEHDAQHQQMGEAITQAIADVHDTLTPDQRKVVADWVMNRVSRHGHWSGGWQAH